MKSIRIIILAIAITVIAPLGAAWAADKPQHSGFLQGYAGFTPDPDRAGARVYWAPGFEVRRYGRITFDPVEILLHPDSATLKPKTLQKLADSFREILIKGAWDSFIIVKRPGPGVISVRAAITNVLGVKKWIGPHYVLNEAFFKAELLDSQTQQRLGALIDTQVGSKKCKRPGEWEDVEKTLEFYANRFRQRMEKARGWL